MRVLIVVCVMVLLCWMLCLKELVVMERGLMCCYLRMCTVLLWFMIADKIEITTIQIVAADLISVERVEGDHDVYLSRYRRGPHPDRVLSFLPIAPCEYPKPCKTRMNDIPPEPVGQVMLLCGGPDLGLVSPSVTGRVSEYF